MNSMNLIKSITLRLAALMLVLCLLPVGTLAEEMQEEDGWVTFLLQCNEGMQNNGGNVGNTMMVVAMNWLTGKIRMMALTWDTFVDYEGYDVPQKIDMTYRNNGPEETVKVFNQNFGMDIDHYMSLNYSNLASMIDAYGGVTIDISRAERNALNSMVGSKKDNLQAQMDAGFVNQLLIEMFAQEYYLDDFGPDTHLNGLQAVGYGWLQYDSVYNCCLRESKVISDLFDSVAVSIGEKVIFYTEESGYPENTYSRRAINVEAMTEEDLIFLRQLVDPIFQMSYHNLSEEVIMSLTVALALNAYEALRQGVDIFESVSYAIFPLEALQEYDLVAGTYGHLVDKEANAEAMRTFLFR